LNYKELEKIEFKEIENILTQLIIEKGIDKIYIDNLVDRGVDEKNAKIEEDISYTLNHIIAPNFTIDQIQYLISAAENVTNPILKARYCAVLVECSHKKHENSKKLIDYVLMHKCKVLNENTWTLFDLDLLNLMLLLSSTMGFSKLDVANISLDYVEKNGCLGMIISRLFLLIKGLKIDENEDRNYLLNRTEKIYDELIMKSSQVNDFTALEQLLYQIEKSKIDFINIVFLKSAIAKSYLSLARNGSRSVRELSFAQKASEYAKKINDDELEKECLAVLQNLIANNDIEWKKSEMEFPEELKGKIAENIEHLKAYFSKSKSEDCFKDRIKALSTVLCLDEVNSEGIISTSLIYIPICSFSHIKSYVEGVEENSIFSRFGSISTLGDGKVVSTGFKPLIRAKSTIYHIHAVTNILPAIEALESSEDFSMDVVKEQIIESKNITAEDIEFIDCALDDYSTKRYISFIHVIVPCIESIIRNIYKKEIGVDIQVKNNDNSVQTTLNLSDILKTDAFKARVKEDAHEYLMYLLNDETGQNIRNNVAHRLKNAEYYNEYLSRLLLHILIFLCSI